VHGLGLTSIHSVSPFLEREAGQRRQPSPAAGLEPWIDLDLKKNYKILYHIESCDTSILNIDKIKINYTLYL
jgi:hypothetical protein